MVDALVSNTCGKPCRFESGAGYEINKKGLKLCFDPFLFSARHQALLEWRNGNKKENLQNFTFSFSRRHKMVRCFSSNPAL